MHGKFRIVAYRDIRTGKEHAALVKDPLDGPTLVRIHSECLTGDAFGSARCDCGPQLDAALEAVQESGGVVVYLRQEGRDIGLIDKVAAYELQDQGLDTVEANLQLGHPADARTYEAAKDILADLGVAQVRLMTNNPRKVEALEALGIAVAERVPLQTPKHKDNAAYLAAKKAKLGHLLD